MSGTANKKEFFYIVVLILTFITVIVGATFAIYSLIFRHEEGTSAVYTGTLLVEYLSGEIINFDILTPMLEADINTKDNVYRNNFKVENTGSLDSLLSIYVEINLNEFSDETLMYNLYNSSGELINSDFLEGKNEVVLKKDIVLTNNTAEEFVLVIWLKENGMDQNSEMRKNFRGQIRVDASQKID